MSHKSKLEIIDEINLLDDKQLRAKLVSYNKVVGPITDSTRELYRKSLIACIQPQKSTTDAKQSNSFRSLSPKDKNPYEALKESLNGRGDVDFGESSDEDYSIQSESEDEEESTQLEDYDVEDEEDEDNEEETEPVNYSRDLTMEVAPNKVARFIRDLVIAFFIAIFSYYFYSNQNIDFMKRHQPLKAITKQLLTLACFFPIGYAIYRCFAYFRRRRHEELEKVYEFVNKALELLQSPDNPQLMPILHIRDTLLGPAERKTPKAISTWSKAVKFVEENESRVIVELVNIDGEDFRAWKWIGSRKLWTSR